MSCLRAVATLSERMLDAARISDWETLQRLEAEERTQIGQWRSLTTTGVLVDAEQKRLLHAILERHDAILALAKPLHQDLKTLLEAFPEAAGTDR